jgi:hypothetical protein
LSVTARGAPEPAGDAVTGVDVLGEPLEAAEHAANSSADNVIRA